MSLLGSEANSTLGPRRDGHLVYILHGRPTHLKLRQCIGSSFPRTLVIASHTICQDGLEADTKDGFGSRGKLFCKCQRGSLSAGIELCLNRSKLCGRRGDDEGCGAKIQLGGSVEGYDLGRFQDVKADNR